MELFQVLTKALLLGLMLSTLAKTSQSAPISNETASTSSDINGEPVGSQEGDVSATTADPPTSGGNNTEMGQLSLSDVAELVKRNAQTTGIAAFEAYNYVVMNFLGGTVPEPAAPCFSEERDARELDGHINPDINYLQRLVDDISNLYGYISYLNTVEALYNDTLNKTPVCGYCIRYHDLRASTDNLMTSLETLIITADPALSVNHTLPTPGDEDPCYGLCFEQQARVYLRYRAFTGVYIVNDVNGLVQQKLNTKKN